MLILPGVRLRLLASQLILLLFSVCSVFVGNIFAQSSGGVVTINGPDLSNPAYSQDSKYWGQCTWYARGRAKENDNAELTAEGNAGSWPITDHLPKVHSIAVWEGPTKKSFGHVAYVEKVIPIPAQNPQKYDIYITEANFSNCSKNTCFPQKDIVGGDFGGGFDGCRILTVSKTELDNHSAKRGSYTLRGFYHLSSSPDFAPSSGREMTCTRGKTLRINTFSHQQSGNLVTLSFTGEGITAGAKVLAMGPNWKSDEALVDPLVVADNGEIQLAATISVQAAASFNVAIQNPDMEVSAAQQITVAAAPPAQISNAQPVPAEEPVSTAVTTPDADSAPGALVIPSASPAPETAPAAAPQAIPDAATTAQDSAQQQAAAPQIVDQQAQSPAQPAVPAQAPEQPAADATQSAAQDSTAATQTNFPPVLLRISPGTHTSGQFTVDLYGLNFQQGAKIIAQGIDWNSDQAAVTFLGSNHLQATIVAQNPAQFTIAVQNPDSQTSAARRFVVVQAASAAATSGSTPATASSITLKAPITSPPDAALAASSTGSAPTSSTSAPISAPAPATTAVVTAPASAAPATASPATTTQAVVPISAPPAPSSASAVNSATSTTKNLLSTPTANKSPISAPLLPRGATNNAGSTISVAPAPRSGTPATTSPIVRPVPVAVATSGTSQSSMRETSFCGHPIHPLPSVDISASADCTPWEAGQCVEYAKCRSGFQGSVGTANNWPVSKQPNDQVRAGDVIRFASSRRGYSSDGHVAYVEHVEQDSSGQLRISISEANYGGRTPFPNLNKCGVTLQYGQVRTDRVIGVNDFDGFYRPQNAPGQFLPPKPEVQPTLEIAAGSSFRSGDNIVLVGKNFTRSSRVVLLQTAPGSPELVLTNFTSDGNGSFSWQYKSTCDFKAGSYLIRALDQAPANLGALGVNSRKSNTIALNVSGQSPSCSNGLIKTAQASGPPPVLNPVTPASHPAGQFSIDVYGSGFQPGAKVLVQAANGQSGQASVTYFGSDHLRAIINAPNPAQFTMAVQNPDSQMSTAHPFQVTPSTAVSTKAGQVPAVVNPPRSPNSAPSTPAPVGAPASAGSTVSSAHSTNNPITATPLNTPTPLKQPVIVNSTPVQPNHGSPVVSAPQIKPTPIPVQTIKPMPMSQPNVASYPGNTNTTKPVLRPPSSTTPMSPPSQMPGSTIPAAPGV